MKRKDVLVPLTTFLLMVLPLMTLPADAAIPAEERAALIALYNSTNGDNWWSNDGWKDGENFSAAGTEEYWHGVLVNSGPDRVTGLYLNDNNLVGTIPDEIGNLTGLQNLSMNNNQLSGTIPPALGNLTSLYDLNLGRNDLTGSIPPELGGLFGLQQLYLHKNHIEGGIPAELSNLSSLWALYLSANKLAGKIPVSLTNLTNLSTIAFDYNGLYTDDAGVQAFLDNLNPDWDRTQTIAPADVSVSGVGTSVNVSWTQVEWQMYDGAYLVSYGTTSGGPYTPFGETEDKWAEQLQVTGLSRSTPYYFVVQTRTDSHGDNENTVVSAYSPEQMFTTSAGPGSGLVDNHDGTVTQFRNDGSELMWLKDANYAGTSGYNEYGGALDWQGALDWIDHLNEAWHLGYNDWRLPQALPVNPPDYEHFYTTDGTSDNSYNILSPNSDMSYMYYVELENLGQYAPDGSWQEGYGLTNTGPFINIQPYQWYWTGNAIFGFHAWYFRFNTGRQNEDANFHSGYAWAVRDNVPAPIQPGDVNGDRKINLEDALLALRIACGLPTGGENIALAADVNNDGMIGLPEAFYVLQKIAMAR